MANNTALVKVLADNSDLTKKLAASERRAAAFEKRLNRTKKNTGGIFGPLGKSLQGLAGPLAGATAGFAGIAGVGKLLTDSVDATQDLAKATGRLTALTGLDVKSASAWVSMAKARGIGTEQLTTLFKTSQKQIAGLSDGTKTSTALFDKMGIAQKDLIGLPFDQQLLRISDGLKGVTDPAVRSKLAFQLFGRQAGKVFALMSSGSVELGQQVEWFKRYGATLDEDTIKNAQKLTKQQQRVNAMMDKFKVAIGEKLIPILADFQERIVRLGEQWRDRTGEGGKLRAQFEKISKAVKEAWNQLKPLVKGLVDFVAKNPDLVKMGVYLLGVKAALGLISFATPIASAGKFIGKLNTIRKTEAGQQAVSKISGAFGGLWGKTRGHVGRFGSRLGSALSTAGSSAAGMMTGSISTATKKSTSSGRLAGLVGTFRGSGTKLGRGLVVGIALGVALGLPSFLKDLGKMLWDSVKDPNVILHGGNVTKGRAWRDFQAKYGLAQGGVVRSARIAMIGEDGPEAVVPLTKPRRARAVMSEAGLLGASGGNRNYFTINTTGPVNEQALARSIGWQLATRGLA